MEKKNKKVATDENNSVEVQNNINTNNENLNILKKRKKEKESNEKMKKQKKSKNSKKKKNKKEETNDSKKEENENLKNAALQYLQIWKHNQSEWKFKKTRQNWLFKCIFNSQKIPNKLIPILIEYASQSQGLARKRLIEQAQKIIKKVEEMEEQGTKIPDDDSQSSEGITQTSFARARLVIQSIE